jgi:hypothetical protein
MAKGLPSGAIRFGCHVVAIHQDPGTHGAILTTVDGCVIKAKAFSTSMHLVEIKSAMDTDSSLFAYFSN